MIPKTVHYCWFGKGPMPALAHKCIASWKKYLPDYELKLWDESTFDISSNTYVKEAYEARKFAFVTDYVRLFALYTEGGVYMDTDVQVIKKLDDFLTLPAFTGFESDKDVPTGIMAGEKAGKWAEEQLSYYENRHFLISGKPDLTTNVQIISGIMARNGFVLENSYQVYKDCMHVFPKDYFCPKSRTGVVTLTENTHCIHHFNGSWQSKRMKMKKFLFHKILGTYFTDKLVRLKRSIIKKQ
ncbi:MAG: glycosyltransferase family 32 protein [Bacteroidota bacterium]